MVVLGVPIRARQLLQRDSIATTHPASIFSCEDVCMPALNISFSLHSDVAIVNGRSVASAGIYAPRTTLVIALSADFTRGKRRSTRCCLPREVSSIDVPL